MRRGKGSTKTSARLPCRRTDMYKREVYGYTKGGMRYILPEIKDEIRARADAGEPVSVLSREYDISMKSAMLISKTWTGSTEKAEGRRHHTTEEEREEIRRRHAAGESKSSIARSLGRNINNIVRILKYKPTKEAEECLKLENTFAD